MRISARAKALFVVVTMLAYSLGAPAAVAIEAQTPTTYNVNFDVLGAANGSTYDITFQDVAYSVTVVDGPDKTFTVAPGTSVSFSFSDYLYVTDSWRSSLDGRPGSPTTINADTTLTATYNPDEFLVTFDQTGLPNGTEYNIWFGGIKQALFLDHRSMVAGTPWSLWVLSGAPLVLEYDAIAYNYLGAYHLVDYIGYDPVTPDAAGTGSQGFVGGVTGPMDIVGVYGSAGINGTVFYDYNNNGVQDPGEPGISGATVELFGVFQEVPEPNGAISGASIPNGLSSLLTTITNSAGVYAFGNLPAGTFYTRVTLPDGSQSDSGAIVLGTTGDAVNSGQADFPQSVELLNTGR